MNKVERIKLKNNFKMKKIFKLLFYSNLLSFYFILLYSNTSEKTSSFPSTREIYTSIQKRNNQLTPNNYSAILESPLIDAQLKNIPAESRIFGKKPYVIFQFKKNQVPILTIKNIASYQASFFSIYEDILLRSGMLLGIGKWFEYKKFIKEHQIFLTINNSENQNEKNTYHYKVKVEEKEGLPGDYGEYYFSKDWDLLFSKYFVNKKLSAEVRFFYRWEKPYRFVNKLHIRLLDLPKNFNLFFKKINYN